MKSEYIVGLLFIVLFFLPTANYEYSCCDFSRGLATGPLYGYLLPYGYVALVCGIVLLLNSQFGIIKQVRSGHLLIASGALVLAAMVASRNVDYFLSAWHGVEGSWTVQIDGVANLFSVTIPAVSIALGLIKLNKKARFYFPDL